MAGEATDSPKELTEVREEYRDALDKTIGRREFFRKAGKVAKGAAATTVASAVGLDFLTTPAAAESQSTLPLEPVVWNFSDWQKLTLANQRFIADSMVGKPVIMRADNQDLRLHSVFDARDDVWVDLNVDLTKHSQVPGEKYDGLPVRMRIPKPVYKDFQQRFKRVTEETAGSQNSGIFPGDLEVPQDEIFVTDVDRFVFDMRRGQVPELKLRENALKMDFLDWYKLPRADQRADAEANIGRYLNFNVNTPDLRLHIIAIDPSDPNADVILDLNIDPSKAPYPKGKDDVYPVRVRMTGDAYRNSLGGWKREGKDLYPDIVVPENSTLLFHVIKTPRHIAPAFPKEPYEAQLAFVSLTPSSPSSK